ncbi:MAG: hypothetical protein HN417_05270 [Desulfobacula sp.]|jgi:hypothetical protein|nr:hypothetical protein [Desulfobacula sp.]
MKRLLIIILLIFCSNSFAQDIGDPLKEILTAKSLKFSFEISSNAEWLKTNPKTNTIKSSMSFVFDSIDYREGSARMIGNQGSVGIAVFKGAQGVSFIEFTQTGSIITTTVFYEYSNPDRKLFKAVHSRHTSIAGAFPSQYYGDAEIWSMD